MPPKKLLAWCVACLLCACVSQKPTRARPDYIYPPHATSFCFLSSRFCYLVTHPILLLDFDLFGFRTFILRHSPYQLVDSLDFLSLLVDLAQTKPNTETAPIQPSLCCTGHIDPLSPTLQYISVPFFYLTNFCYFLTFFFILFLFCTCRYSLYLQPD